MTDTFRALCADLLVQCDAGEMAPVEAMEDIRTALAQPEPVGRPWPVPGDAEGLAEVFWGNYDQFEPERPSEKETFALWSEMRGAFEEPTSWRDFDDIIRAALDRWGRPAIEPVPVAERLPGEGDCNAERECFWFDGCDWKLDTFEKWYTHWLPHWALPAPASQQGP